MSKSWERAGFFIVPVLFSLLQCWASGRIILQLQPHRVTDGAHYIQQGWLFQVADIRDWLYYSLFYGLYPAFLGHFHVPGLDWSVAGTDPSILPVYAMQSLLLAVTTAVFLYCSFEFVSGNSLIRITLSVLLGVLLLSPLVIVWPAEVLDESLTLSFLFLFLSACVGFDDSRDYFLSLIGIASCLLIFVRYPIVLFVWVFAGMIGLNILLARVKKTTILVLGLVTLVAAIGLGAARSALIAQDNIYVQSLVDVIQLRILPDPKRRTFFAERGLPSSQMTMTLSGKPAPYENWLFMPDDEVPAEFVEYRNWVVANGFKTYAAFLLRHPGYLVRSIAVSPNLGPKNFASDVYFSMLDLFSLPRDRGYWTELVPYPPAIRDFLLAPLGSITVVLYLCCAVLRYGSQTIRRQRVSSMETVAIAGAIAMFAGYHADALDPWRHSIPFLIIIYVSFLLRTPAIVISVVRVTTNDRILGSGLKT